MFPSSGDLDGRHLTQNDCTPCMLNKVRQGCLRYFLYSKMLPGKVCGESIHYSNLGCRRNNAVFVLDQLFIFLRTFEGAWEFTHVYS